jgi:UDP-galactopyranose mutase
VDVAHFAAARAALPEPDDQRAIPRPRVGFHGVVDERMDVPLVEAVARAHPEWHLVVVGPVVKIDPASLPRLPNVHWLGQKRYEELPAYVSGWDVAMMPFARNAATRYISPTKTPEFLAAGKRVVSTAIRDVVRPYGERGLVAIANDPHTFAAAIADALRAPRDPWRAQVDAFVSTLSWDATFRGMSDLLDRATARPHVAAAVEAAGEVTP